jgi:hypothetical protein
MLFYGLYIFNYGFLRPALMLSFSSNLSTEIMPNPGLASSFSLFFSGSCPAKPREFSHVHVCFAKRREQCKHKNALKTANAQLRTAPERDKIGARLSPIHLGSRSMLQSFVASSVFQQPGLAKLLRLVSDTAALQGQCADAPRPPRALARRRRSVDCN